MYGDLGIFLDANRHDHAQEEQFTMCAIQQQPLHTAVHMHVHDKY